MLSVGQEPGGLGAELRIRLVERIEEQQVTQMKEGRFHLAEVEVVPFPESVCAAVMKEGSPAITLFRHHVGIGSISFRRFAQKARIDFMTAAIIQNQFAQRVLADEAGGNEGKVSAEFGQVKEHVVRRATCALGLAAYVGQLLPLREHVNQFDLVDDPVSAAEDTAPSR